MYEEAFRTPLIIKYPEKINQGIISEMLVQNLDIAPTILDLAGIRVPEDMQGLSLLNLLNESDDGWRDALYYHYYEKGFLVPPHYGIRTGRYKLIHFYDNIDAWEFYDLETDPNEMKNIYSDPRYEQQIVELKTKLKKLQKKYMDPI